MKFVVLELVWNVVDCLKTHQVDHIKQILLKLIIVFVFISFLSFKLLKWQALAIYHFTFYLMIYF